MSRLRTSAVVATTVLTLAGCSSNAAPTRPTTGVTPRRSGASTGAITPDVAGGRPVAQRIRGAGHWRTLRVAVPDHQRVRNVYVYTPDVAHPDLLPVVYLLHGLPANVPKLCNATAGAELDAAFRRGATPFVLACPDGTYSVHKDNEWGDSTDGRDRLETFVTDQARRAVEGDHPRPRSLRAIAGLSMGGFGAAAIALRHPSLYSAVVPMAGYFVVDDPSNVFGRSPAQVAAHDPSHLVSAAKGQSWFLLDGTKDHDKLTRYADAQFLPLLRRAGAAASSTVTDGTHSSAWALAQLPLVARLLSRVWGG